MDQRNALLTHRRFLVSPVKEGSTYILPSASFTGNLTDINLSSLFGSSSSLPTRQPKSTQPSINAAPTELSISSSDAITAINPTSSACFDNTAAVASSSSTSTSSNDDGNGLGTGALVGIIVGAAVVVIGGLALVIVLVRRKRQSKKFNPGRGITPSMVISTRSSYNNYDSGGNTAVPMVIEAPRLHPPTPSPPPPPASPSPAIQGVKQYNHPSPTYLAPPTAAAISSRHQKQPNSTSPIYHSTMASSSSPTTTSSPDRRLSKYNYLAQAFSQMRRPDSQVSTYPSTIQADNEDEPLSPTLSTHTTRRAARYHYI